MTNTSKSERPSAFSWWLRTGRLPPVRSPEGVELKFNPWHDPADGRFTFAGAGRFHGASGAGSANRGSDRETFRKPRIATASDSKPPRADLPAEYAKWTENRAAIEAPKSRPTASRPHDPPNPVAEFIGGVGEGLYGVGEGTVEGLYSVATTNPVTTVRNTGRGVADMIDRAIEAEDTPARIQISRAADAVANASARDIGRATGSVVGNVALTAVPGGAIGKVAALRRLRMIRPRATFDPPKIGWVKEVLKSDEAWKVYNDAAPGGRPDQAPTLMRTMPDGSKRPVKFDGVQGDYVIDRKWSVMGKPRAVAQTLRQSEVLAQHRLIGMWEVPTPAKKAKALKLLKKINVTNISVRVVEP